MRRTGTRAKDEQWFNSLVEAQKTRNAPPASTDTEARLRRAVPCEWIHNATVRQVLLERASETSGKMVGSWTLGAESPEPRVSGTLSNKDYTIELYHQKKFFDKEVKRITSVEDDPRKQWFEGNESLLLHLARSRRAADQKEWRPPSPPLSWKPESAKPQPKRRLQPLLHRSMSPQTCVRLIDWQCFGKRNHIKILREQPFEEQHGVPKGWAETRAMTAQFGSRPRTLTLSEYAERRRQGLGSTMQTGGSHVSWADTRAVLGDEEEGVRDR